MFVVRIKRPNEDFDFKALKSKKAATARFRTAQAEMIDGEVEECALFDAPTSDAEHAVDMVNQGRARLIEFNLDSGAARHPSAPRP